MDVEAGIDQPLPQEIIDEIVRRVLTVAKPDRIILFGSAATGKMTRDSDIDLLIVEPELEWKAEVWLDERFRIAETLGALGYSFDIKLIRTKWFEESKEVIGGIAYPANKYGKVIYDAA